MRRGVVEAALRQSVADHVFPGRDNSLLGSTVTLDSTDVCGAQFRDQIRILAVSLLDPAPAGIAGDIEYWGESLLSAGRT